jgi:hypothetical protein
MEKCYEYPELIKIKRLMKYIKFFFFFMEKCYEYPELIKKICEYLNKICEYLN